MKYGFLNCSEFILAIALLFLSNPAVLAESPVVEVGKNKVKVEVAQSQAEIERGLMFRTSLPEDHGMIFLFHPPRKVRFWMFNCNISLDMLFIKDGKILKISRDVPPCRSADPHECPTYPADGEIDASEVLEVNAGYCQRHGVKEGDSVRFRLPGPAARAGDNQKPKLETAPQSDH